MKYLKKKKRNPLVIPVVILSILVIVLAAILLWPDRPSEDPVPSETTADETQAATKTPTQTSVPTETGAVTSEYEREADLEVETPYATLYYPAQWAGGVRAEVQENEIGADVLFYGEVKGREALLFTVSFGGAEGFPVGVYETREGYLLDVTTALSDLELDESWMSADMDSICAMQEGINYVLEKLEEDPGFSAN